MQTADDALRVAIPTDDLCLAYVNTRSWRGSPVPTEELHTINDVTGWISTTAPANAALATQCAAHWLQSPGEAAMAFAAAIGLREILYRVFASVAASTTPDLTTFNIALAQAASRSRLVCDDGTYAWVAEPGPASAARLLSGVLWSAADVLAGPRRARLRVCANPKCGYLFLDDSKPGNRRWCAMSACGNRAKAHRHYLKTKAAKQTAA